MPPEDEPSVLIEQRNNTPASVMCKNRQKVCQAKRILCCEKTKTCRKNVLPYLKVKDQFMYVQNSLNMYT